MRGEPLRLTRNKSKAAHYLTPSRIGLWLGLAEADALDDVHCRTPLVEPWYRECRCSRRSLDRLLGLLGRANAEGELYFPHVGTAVLLAALWLLARSKVRRYAAHFF